MPPAPLRRHLHFLPATPRPERPTPVGSADHPLPDAYFAGRLYRWLSEGGGKGLPPVSPGRSFGKRNDIPNGGRKEKRSYKKNKLKEVRGGGSRNYHSGHQAGNFWHFGQKTGRILAFSLATRLTSLAILGDTLTRLGMLGTRLACFGIVGTTLDKFWRF